MEPLPDQVAQSKTLLEQYLAGCDEPCPSCGYNLRHLQGGRCPECGDALKLHVGLVDPRRGPFVTGLMGLAAGGGFSGLLLLFAIGDKIVRGRGGPEAGIVVMWLVELLVSIVLVSLWLRHAPRLRRMTPSTHWVFAMLCCLWPPLNLVTFMIAIR